MQPKISPNSPLCKRRLSFSDDSNETSRGRLGHHTVSHESQQKKIQQETDTKEEIHTNDRRSLTEGSLSAVKRTLKRIINVVIFIALSIFTGGLILFTQFGADCYDRAFPGKQKKIQQETDTNKNKIIEKFKDILGNISAELYATIVSNCPNPKSMYEFYIETSSIFSNQIHAALANKFNKERLSFKEFGCQTGKNAIDLAVHLGANLEYADFTGFNIKNEDLEKLSTSCPNVIELNLSGNKEVSQSGFINLSELKNLEVLILNDCKLENSNITPFMSYEFPKLRILDLGNNTIETTTKVNDMAKTAINLTELKLTNCGLVSYNKVNLSNFKNLKTLDLGNNPDLDIKKAKLNPNLTSLAIGHSKYDDAKVMALTKFDHLCKLDLRGNPLVTSKGLIKALKNMHIKELDVSSCNLTDLSFVNDMPELDTIYVSDNPNLKFSEINNLKDRRKNLSVMN